MKQETTGSSRRDFLKTTTVAAGTAALAANLTLMQNAHAQGNDLIRVGLIGCGGRGRGAARQCVLAGQNVKLWAMGDAFRDKLDAARNYLMNNNEVANRIDVTPARCFVGLDAFEQVISNCDLVILATPPGFRPRHLQAAVAARKHIFTEKPVAVDGPGIRTCLATFEEANRHRLSIVAGTQRRYQTSYLESMRRIHGGDLGTILSARCYWNQGHLWNVARTQNMTDLEWQLRNWLYFTWLSGDHYVEQHVHNIDVINWALNAHPTRASGMGGRQVRTAAEFGHIFDHFAVEFEYPNDVHVLSMARQIDHCENNVSESIVGTTGKWSSLRGHRIRGQNAWTFANRDPDPYQQEHNALIASIRSGQPINDLRKVAESTLTAIMGRMSTYTGRAVTWDDALNSQTHLMPANLAWNMNLPVPAVAMPGG